MNCNDRLQNYGLIEGLNHKKGKIQDSSEKRNYRGILLLRSACICSSLFGIRDVKAASEETFLTSRVKGALPFRGVFGRKISFNEV